MKNVNHLEGSIYHMVHIDNVQSILQWGALLSKELVLQNNVTIRSIAYESVQQLRDRIFVWDFIEQRYRKLHSYVPFYFATNPPMLYVQRDEERQDRIVFLVISRSILNDPGVLFTDGNASIQQLSGNGNERMGIIPATKSQSCRRTYKPKGPYGTNMNRSNFYGDVAYLENLNWSIINGTHHKDFGEGKRIRSAEALIPDKISLNKIQRIAVRTEKMAQTVRDIVEECGLVDSAPPITVDPSLYIV